jgi:hypothetical protein
MNYLVTLTSDEAYEFLFTAKSKAVRLMPRVNAFRWTIRRTPQSIGLQYYVYYLIYEDMAQRTERLVSCPSAIRFVLTVKI